MNARDGRWLPAALRSSMTGCMLAILTFAVCWTAAVCDWRAQDDDPGTGELMFFLFILPGALLAAALMARQRLDDDRASQDEPADAGDTAMLAGAAPHAGAVHRPPGA